MTSATHKGQNLKSSRLVSPSQHQEIPLALSSKHVPNLAVSHPLPCSPCLQPHHLSSYSTSLIPTLPAPTLAPLPSILSGQPEVLFNNINQVIIILCLRLCNDSPVSQILNKWLYDGQEAHRIHLPTTPHPRHLSASPTTLPLAHSAPPLQASPLFCEHARRALPQGLCTGRSTAQNTLHQDIYRVNFFTSFLFLLQCQLLKEASPDHFI